MFIYHQHLRFMHKYVQLLGTCSFRGNVDSVLNVGVEKGACSLGDGRYEVDNVDGS